MLPVPFRIFVPAFSHLPDHRTKVIMLDFQGRHVCPTAASTNYSASSSPWLVIRLRCLVDEYRPMSVGGLAEFGQSQGDVKDLPIERCDPCPVPMACLSVVDARDDSFVQESSPPETAKTM